MRDMNDFFIQFEPANNSNLYGKFLNEFRNSLKDIIFSTLNYDVIFELAAEKLSLEIEYIPYITEKVRFWKLHDSSNFLPANNISIRDCIGLNLVQVEKMKFVSRNEVKEHLQSGLLSAIMCIYMPNKPYQTFSNDIELIQKAWNEMVSKADKILIIGDRPNTNDHHIWDSLTNTESKIGYIGSKEDFTNWKKIFLKTRRMNFSDSIGRIVIIKVYLF